MAWNLRRVGCAGLGVMMLLLAACKSDEERLAELRSDVAFAELTVRHYRRTAEPLSRYPGADTLPVYRAYADSLRTAENRLLLAQRELDRFLR